MVTNRGRGGKEQKEATGQDGERIGSLLLQQGSMEYAWSKKLWLKSV